MEVGGIVDVLWLNQLPARYGTPLRPRKPEDGIGREGMFPAQNWLLFQTDVVASSADVVE